MGSLEQEKSIVVEWTAFIQQDRLLRERERERARTSESVYSS